MYAVTIVEYPVNKSTTYRFDKLKKAYDFLRMAKKMYKNAYFCLFFDVS